MDHLSPLNAFVCSRVSLLVTNAVIVIFSDADDVFNLQYPILSQTDNYMPGAFKEEVTTPMSKVRPLEDTESCLLT